MPIRGRWRLQPDSSPCTTGSFHTARGPIPRRIDASVSPSTIRPRRQGPPAASDRQRCSCVAMIVTGISKRCRRQRANSRPRRSPPTIGLSVSIERLTLKRKPPTICSGRDRGSASRENAARSGLCRRRRATPACKSKILRRRLGIGARRLDTRHSWRLSPGGGD